MAGFSWHTDYLFLKMAKIIFVLGGARSGKSAFAEGLAKKYHDVAYIATAEAKDDEMRERIRVHRERRPASWMTVESPYHIERALSGLNGRVSMVLIDCITLYITNMLLNDEKAFPHEVAALYGSSSQDQGSTKLRQKHILGEINNLSQVCRESKFDVILIANEVGLGIVPDNALSREFRDIAGCANQILAEEADEVFFLMAGIPQRLK